MYGIWLTVYCMGMRTTFFLGWTTICSSLVFRKSGSWKWFDGITNNWTLIRAETLKMNGSYSRMTNVKFVVTWDVWNTRSLRDVRDHSFSVHTQLNQLPKLWIHKIQTTSLDFMNVKQFHSGVNLATKNQQDSSRIWKKTGGVLNQGKNTWEWGYDNLFSIRHHKVVKMMCACNV